MTRSAQDVPEAELAALRALWALGTATRRQITDLLYPGGGPAHYTTVQKLLERLEERGLVARGGTPQLRTFTAAVGKDDFIRLRLLDVADKLCEGSLTPLLMNLVQSRPLSDAELAELRRVVRAHGKEGGKP
ncbi:MAG: BlaI/MecI/CopY family transcriptional regulator [Gemmataceae bacterium]